MKKLTISERKRILNLFSSGMTQKEVLSTLSITYSQFKFTKNSIKSFNNDINEVRRNDLSIAQKDSVLTLIRAGKEIKECLIILKIPHKNHLQTLKKNKTYKKNIEKSKRIYELQQQTHLIKTLRKFKGDVKKSLSHLNIKRNKFYKWKNEEDFNNRLFPFPNIKINKVPSKLYPKDLEFTRVEKGVFYNGREIVGRFCQVCRTVKPINFFYVNNNDTKTKSTSNCIDCISLKEESKLRNRHGLIRKGRHVKKINSNSNTTHRRCTHCDKFKHLKEFDKLYLGIHVCNKCFKLDSSYNPQKRGEFYKGEKVRWFDKFNFVTHKRCSKCKMKRPLNDYSKNNHNRLDGRGLFCVSCR